MHTVGKIRRTESQQVVVSTQTYGGSEKIDVRVFYKDRDGKWKPTAKGLRIQFGEAEALSRLIEKAENARRSKLGTK